MQCNRPAARAASTQAARAAAVALVPMPVIAAISASCSLEKPSTGATGLPVGQRVACRRGSA